MSPILITHPYGNSLSSSLLLSMPCGQICYLLEILNMKSCLGLVGGLFFRRDRHFRLDKQDALVQQVERQQTAQVSTSPLGPSLQTINNRSWRTIQTSPSSSSGNIATSASNKENEKPAVSPYTTSDSAGVTPKRRTTTCRRLRCDDVVRLVRRVGRAMPAKGSLRLELAGSSDQERSSSVRAMGVTDHGGRQGRASFDVPVDVRNAW